MKGFMNLQYDNFEFCNFDENFLKYRKSVEGITALPLECTWNIYCLGRQCLNVDGEFWECGVDKGGSAKFISQFSKGKTLRLFDTFSGMPKSDPDIDQHAVGDFTETSLESVKALVDATFHPGLIPETFKGLEDSKIAFAHIDCDIYQSTKDCCEFIYPRMSKGGVMLFDDYSRPTCPGVSKAVDAYFKDKKEVPWPVMMMGQAIVFKL